MMLWLGVVFAQDCPRLPVTAADCAGLWEHGATELAVCADGSCVGLDVALACLPDDHPPVIIRSDSPLPSVHRVPVSVYALGADVTIDAENMAFVASASDPSYGDRFAQFCIQTGRVRFEQGTFGPVNIGAIFAVSGAELELSDVTVAPGASGWGLWVRDSEVHIEDSLFAGGVTFVGTHVFLEGSVATVIGSDFVGGVASQSGGSFELVSQSTLSVRGGSFQGNRAPFGGAIAASSGSGVWINGEDFVVEDDPARAFEETAFVDNTATEAGGAIYGSFYQYPTLGDGELIVRRARFEGNQAGHGGAVYAGSLTSQVQTSTFCENSAGEGGGAFHTGGSAEAFFHNVRFLDNNAAQGGAVYLDAGTHTFSYTSLLGNAATTDGAAMQVATYSFLDDGSFFEGMVPAGVESRPRPRADLYTSVVAFSATSRAIEVDVEDDEERVELHSVAFSANAIGDEPTSGVSLRERAVIRGEDLQLNGYAPDQGCGLANDTHSANSPLATRAAALEELLSGPVPTLPCRLTALFEPAQPLPDEYGGFFPDEGGTDLGAYGGACGFPEVAWRDLDEDTSPSIYDCDDGDAAIHPEAAEIWYDGVDQDCDGRSDFDQDGDGFDRGAPPVGVVGLPGQEDDDGQRRPDATELDCNDLRADVNPGVQIDDDPVVDKDCDGVLVEGSHWARERAGCLLGGRSAVWLPLPLAALALRSRRRRGRSG